MKLSIMKTSCKNYVVFPVILFLTGVFFFIPADKAGALTLDEIIAKTQGIYEKTAGLKADFTQESVIKSMGKTEREEGVFYFKTPRRMLWDYTKPKKKKLIINPKTAWLYIPEDRIVYVQDAENLFKSRIGIRFLSGLGKLQEDFHISFAKPEHTGQEGDYLFKLVPKEPDFGIGNLLIVIDRETFYVNRLSFVDTYGNTNRLHFRNVKISNKLPDRMFNFSPPPGVDVYR